MGGAHKGPEGPHHSPGAMEAPLTNLQFCSGQKFGTGYTTHFLMFGRHSLLPIECTFGVKFIQTGRSVSVASSWGPPGAYEKMGKAARQRRNSRPLAPPLLPAERVLVCCFHRRSHEKLVDRCANTQLSGGCLLTL